MKMIKNVGLADRILRLGASLMMMYFGFINDTVIADNLSAILLGVFGFLIFLSAVFSICPLYNLIGFSTIDADDKN